MVVFLECEGYKLPITYFSIEKELGDIGKAEVKVPKDYTDFIDAFAGKEYTLKKDGRAIFKGVIAKYAIETAKIRLFLAEWYYKLGRVKFSVDNDYRVEYNNTAASTILSDVLAGTDFSAGYCSSSPVSLRGEYESKLRWVSAIAHALNWGYDSSGNITTDQSQIVQILGECDFWADDNNKVHIGVRGAYRSGDSWKFYPFDISKDILNPEDLVKDYSSLINKIHVLGYGDGLNQVVKTAEDSASQSKYFLCEEVDIDRRIIHDETAQNKANRIIALHKDPVVSFRLRVDPKSFFEGAYDIGSKVKINGFGIIDGEYRIVALKCSINECELELSNKSKRLTNISERIKKDLDVLGSYFQGVTNVSNFGGWETAVDAAHPAIYRFFLPDESVGFVRVNEAFINVYGKAYRIWSKGAASGGGTTTTSAAGSVGENAQPSEGYATSGSTSIGTSWKTVVSYTPNFEVDRVFLFLNYLYSGGVGGQITPYIRLQNITDGITLRDYSGKLNFEATDHGSAYNGNGEFSNIYVVGSGSSLKGKTIALQAKKATSYVEWAFGILVVISKHNHGNHTHNVTLPNHTHNPNPGIYETSDYPSNVEIWLYNSSYPTGVKIADSTSHPGLAGGNEFSVTKIDIKNYVTHGENKIEVRSESLGQIQLDGFYRIFIKTK